MSLDLVSWLEAVYALRHLSIANQKTHTRNTVESSTGNKMHFVFRYRHYPPLSGVAMISQLFASGRTTRVYFLPNFIPFGLWYVSSSRQQCKKYKIHQSYSYSRRCLYTFYIRGSKREFTYTSTGRNHVILGIRICYL